MHRIPIIAVLLAFVMVLSSISALAATATPNQRLSFRTGPNTRFTELFTLPQSTEIKPLAYEDGNGVTWVLCEFMYDNKLWQGYTGLKRMTINGNIPWATNFYSASSILKDVPVFAAPTLNADKRGMLRKGDYVACLQTLSPCERPDCEDCMLEKAQTYLHFPASYAFVEYIDADSQQFARGWIRADALAQTGLSAGYLLEDSDLYSTDNSSKVGRLSKNTIVAEFPASDRPGYSQIQYRDMIGVHKNAYIASENLKIY